MTEQHFVGKVAIKVIIEKDGMVLLVRGHRDENRWELPGGRMNTNESIEAALQREIKEELDLNATF
jgi:8-oxo-dGTP diphosphatase